VDLVEYQDAAIVTRTVFDASAATVTMFAFDEGQGLSEHSTPFDAMIYAAEGKAQVTIAGVAHELGDGQVIPLPANKPHAVRALSRFKMLLIMVR
jgi:quercetin dioxygenase-like cupin family protein